MRRRFLVAIGLLTLFGTLFIAYTSRSQAADDRSILRTTVRDEVNRDHSFESLPRYTIRVKVDSSLDAFSAEQTVSFTNKAQIPLNDAVFHLYPNASIFTKRGKPGLTIENVTVNGAKAMYRSEGEELRIQFPSSLAPGNRTEIGIQFLGHVPSISAVRIDSPISMLRDLMRSMLNREINYGVYAVGDRVLNLGHWFPMLSHHDGKNWDTVSAAGVGDVAFFDVANYDVTIDAPREAQVIASGVAQKNDVRGDRRIAHYLAGASRDFAAQISPRYESASRVVDGVTVNSHYFQGHQASGSRTLDVATKALAYYNRTIGPYPYTELDIVEAPLASIIGGMEHPGLVTINGLLYEMDKIKLGKKLGDKDLDAAIAHFDGLSDRMLSFVVAHEVAHQWWNASVGSNSKTHPFLDESLANHSARMCLEAIQGKDAAEEQAFLNIELTYQLHRAVGGKDRPVDLPAKAFGGTSEYAGIVYGKGAMFFRALEEQLGKERFQTVLRKYYDRYEFDIAGPEDLLAIAREHSPNPAKVQILFHRWLDESQGDTDIGPIQLGRVFDIMIAPVIGKNSTEAKVIRTLTTGIDGILRDSRAGNAELIDRLLTDLDAVLSGKPLPETSTVGTLLKAFDELLNGLSGAGNW